MRKGNRKLPGGWLAIWLGLLVLGLTAGIGIAFLRNQKPVALPERRAGRSQFRAVSIGNLMPTITPAARMITMAAVGDVMLGRTVREQMIKRGDWSWPFQETFNRLAKADLTVGNLEAPIVEGCTQHQNRMVFCMSSEAIEGLKQAGFDAWTLANNHMLNYGQQGLAETKRWLITEGMPGSYGGELVRGEVKGVTWGILGYDDVSQPLNLELIKQQTASAAAQTDILLTMVHWGNEYTASPSARQKAVAAALAAGGANVIIGSHPHWVQNVEKLGKTLVFWSLGNFVFDQMWSEETRQGAMAELRLQITDDGLQEMEYELVPVKIYEYGQPRWIEREEKT